jgi:hypothetical protein
LHFADFETERPACHGEESIGRVGKRVMHRSKGMPLTSAEHANGVSNAVDYAKSYSRSHDAVICVYDAARNVIETHEQADDFRSPCSTRRDLWRGKAMAETPIFAMKKTSKAEFYAIEAGSKLMNGNAHETNRTPNAWRMEALRYLREGLGASVAAKRERSKKKIAHLRRNMDSG